MEDHQEPPPQPLPHDEQETVATIEMTLTVDEPQQSEQVDDFSGGVVILQEEFHSVEIGNGHTPRTISSIVTVTPADLLEPTFPCPHCPRFFNRRNMVTRHINEIHKIALPFQCDLCDKTFSVIPSLQKHLMNHHDVDPEPYQCEACRDTFTLQKLLEDHRCPAAPTKPRPQSTPKRTKTVKIIPLKRLKKKAPPPPKKFCCNICSKGFKTRSTLARHVGGHGTENKAKDLEMGGGVVMEEV